MLLPLATLAVAAEPADLSGSWRMDLHIVHDVKVPILGRSRSDSYTVQLWTIEGDQITNEHCSIRAETRLPIGKPRIPEAFTLAIPKRQATLELEGAQFTVDMGVSTIGYTKGELPTTAEDPRVIDHEDDGHPGATISVWAPLFGTVPLHVVQRTHLFLDGQLEEDAIRGTAKQTEIAQYTLEAGNRLFKKQPELTPVFEESTFALTRVEPTVTCAEIAEPNP